MAFFDNQIIDANTPSYTHSSWEAIANRTASSKKEKKCKSAAEELQGSFTSLMCSTDAVLNREYAYQKRLASCLASK